MNPYQKKIVFIIICLLAHTLPVKAIQQIYTPDILQPWQKWVLHDQKQYNCPHEYNNEKKRHCVWISHLDLNLKKRNSHFSMKGIVFEAQYVLLPGQNGCWPDGVGTHKNLLAVIPFKEHPAVFLPEGPFEISGHFLYDHLPESLYIPPQLGLLTLKRDNKIVGEPFISKDYRLWLRNGQVRGPSGNRMHVQIYRLITDQIPMTMTHHLQLSVSGNSREEVLNHVLPDQSIVMSIDSPLPIQLEKNKDIRLHVRTGKWTIKIVSRFTLPIQKLSTDFLINDIETWSFKSQTFLRIVKLSGLQGLDPASSGVPKEWQNFPAYRVHKNRSVTFQEQQRGDPDPSPDQLSLNRNLWLDFDGKGYTIQDQIKGTIKQNWRLNMYSPIELGRVSFLGKDQLLTQYNNQSGVEIRTGQLNMTADARYTNSISRIPAVGWDHAMNHVQANLNLPPGWRLLSVFGVDSVFGSWLGQWRLLDLFLALLIGMAIYQLKNIQWAVLAWLTMALTFHEPSAPHLTWLHLLAVIALLIVAPQGRFYSFMRLWFVFAVVLISIFILPFMKYQIQSGLFPQLEKHTYNSIPRFRTCSQSLGNFSQFDHFEPGKRTVMPKSATAHKYVAPDKKSQRVSDVVIQTGPGLPKWKWRSVHFSWNGPIDKMQYIRLWLIPPYMNGILSITRVILVSVLLFGIGRRFSQLAQENSNK